MKKKHQIEERLEKLETLFRQHVCPHKNQVMYHDPNNYRPQYMIICKDCDLVLNEYVTNKEYRDFCLKQAKEELLELQEKVANVDSSIKYWENKELRANKKSKETKKKKE